MMYTNKQFISIGMKYFVNFGKYRHFSSSVVGGSSFKVESLSLMLSPFDDVVDLDSLMNKNATNPINGAKSVQINIVFGVIPMSHNAA